MAYKEFMGTASILKRIFALILDVLIINLIIVRPFRSLIYSVIGGASGFNEMIELFKNNQVVLTNLTSILFVISVISLFYFTIMEWKFSQTIGQMIMGLYIISGEKTIKFWQTFVSNLFIIPFFPFYILWIIDPLYMFFNGQRFSEKIAGLNIQQKYVMKDGKK